jgi:hypothetical protein
MTEEQALAKAQELWGPSAYVLDRFNLLHNRRSAINRWKRYYVGCPDSELTNYPFGNGDSWEEAFEDANSVR